MSNRAWIVFAALMIVLVGRLVYDALGNLDNPLDPTVQTLERGKEAAASPPGETAK